MKKIIAFLLVFSLAFMMMAPLASAAGYERLPIIYIRGNGEPLYDAEGNKLVDGLDDVSFGSDSEEGEEADVTKDKIVDAAVNILKPFVLEGMLFDEWDTYGKAVYEELVPLFGKDAGLDENGNAKNGTGVDKAKLANSEANSKSAYLYNTNQEYEFCFDWRLSPYDHVDRLHEFVQNIMDATGKTQVNIYGRCLGGGLLMAYLEKYGSQGHIKNVMFVDILSNEANCISKALSGKMTFDAAYLEKYLGQVDYLGKAGLGVGFAFTDILNEIVFKTMDFFNQITVTDKLLDGVEGLYAKLYKALIPAIMHASGMATQVNYWTCVADEDIDQAIEIMFPDNEDGIREKYAGLIDKILYYREHVSSDLEGFYDTLTENNIYFGFTGKYGFLNAPYAVDADLPSDSLVSLTHSTFGATTARVGTTLSEEYINARIAEGNGKYISADKVVDLSTAYAPDRTWVLKNAHHDSSDTVMPIIKEFLNGTNQTVDTVTSGTQFMVFDLASNTAVPMTEENCADLEFMEIAEEKKTPFSILTAFFNFISMLIDLISGLFDGSIDLGTLFG